MNKEELLALLAGANAGTKIQGPIVVLPSGDAKIGDCKLRGVPQGVKWVPVKSTRSNSEYLQSPTLWAAQGHLGEHGGAWADSLQDTGIAAPTERSGVQRVDFAALMREATAQPAPAAPAAPAEAPAI